MITKTTFNSELFILFKIYYNLFLRKVYSLFDNAKIHKSEKVSKYFAENYLLAQTIPAYSPWMNPFEKTLLSIKQKARKLQKEEKLTWLPMFKWII